MLREPTVSASEIAFVYAGEIWISPRHGGVARRLIARPGTKTTPRFSPDGRSLAFAGNLYGQEAIYTADPNSGAITQITHAPGNTNLCGWTGDGKIVYMTDAFASWFNWHVRMLYSVPAAGGLPTPFPLAFAGEGAVSADGLYLAYANYGLGLESWKRYRGGYAPDIWLLDLKRNVPKRVTTWEGFDSTPMWHGASLYYVSDRGSEQRRNIWSYDLRTTKHRQLTMFADFDVTSASIGPGEEGEGEIIFEHGAGIGLLNLRSGRSADLKIPMPEDRPSQTETVDFSQYVANWQVEAAGKRAVVEARGDLWLLGGESPAVNLTRSAGSAERSPAWSHDGKHIAYFSDASGEYQLQIMDLESRAVRSVTKLGNGYRELPIWSADDSRIAFYDSSGATYIHTVSSGSTVVAARNQWGREHRLDYSWSPDGDWLAYVLDDSNENSSIWLYEVSTGRSRRITSGAYRDREPIFDPSGDYLYFLSTRDFSDLQYDRIEYLDFIARRPDVVMVAPLRDGIGPPWNRRQESDARPSAALPFEEAERRSLRIPGAIGYLSRLAPLEGGRLLVLNSPPGENGSLLVLHVRPAGPIDTIRVSSDYQVAGDRAPFERTAEGVRELLNAQPSVIRFSGMTATQDSQAEWRQIFLDAWRFVRDFFSDRNMNGKNWAEIRASYEPWVERCAARGDLNYVITEMIGELGSSHTNIGSPGAVAEPPHVDVGMLGVDYVLDRGAYRIAKIYEGAAWDADARNPLRRPGITVGVGDYILRVNGKPIDTTQDPWAAFVGLANRPITLTVSSQPSMDEHAREIAVVPMRSETTLRNRAWIEANREAVLRQTGGRAGYLYLPDTYFYGTKELLRQLRFQMDKAALIVDARWNEGGLMPDRLVALLNRPQFYKGQRQFSLPSATLVTNPAAPKCLLTNAMSASGGDSLPLFFQRLHIGPVIGTRTMGAGGGSGGPTPSFVDGGRVEIRWVAAFDASGGPGVEGRGVSPDIAVEDAPTALYFGHDGQLQTAIDTMNRALAAGHPGGHPGRHPPLP